jgi:alpha-glucosidase
VSGTLELDLCAVTIEAARGACARITRFTPREGGRPALPGFALPCVPRAEPLAEVAGRAPTVLRAGGECVARLAFAPGTSFYGAGEHAGPLELGARRLSFWNTDAFEYDDTRAALYQSHPFVLALLPDGSAEGWLADSVRRGWLDFEGGPAERALRFGFEGEPFELYRLAGAHPRDVLQALAALIGPMSMPPHWALGYHQCRWSYLSAEEVRQLAAEFRRRGLPCDALWLDIDYMDRFRVFTTNREAFPDLAGLTGDLRAAGFRTVAILDPGVAVESELAAAGLRQDVFVKDAAGAPAVGKVWPGPCHFPDFTAAHVREWWSEEVRAFVARTGLDGLWNDMNEPSVMVESKTLPDDCRHAGLDGSGGDHARWHNLYGQLMAAATRAGLERARPEARPFVLTRANHLAGSALAATWTGDNRSTWEHLRWSISMALSLGLSGQPFAGPDVGGFSDNPDAELFARWFELGAFLPFFRGHAEKPTRRKEPWAFGPETELLVRAAIERRMKLLPTLYTLFREAHQTGAPVVRPLWWADPADATLRALDDAFLVGDELLVAPIVHARAHERVVRFPRHAGGWIPFPEGGLAIEERERTVAAPLGTLPLFARAGAILFEHEPRPSTATPPRLLVVHVFCDPAGRAAGRLYEDAGEGHGHESGEFRDTRFTATASETEIVIEEQATGFFVSPAAQRFFVIHVGGKTLLAPRRQAETYRIPRA